MLTLTKADKGMKLQKNVQYKIDQHELKNAPNDSQNILENQK